jgi:hypothetical protein
MILHPVFLDIFCYRYPSFRRGGQVVLAEVNVVFCRVSLMICLVDILFVSCSNSMFSPQAGLVQTGGVRERLNLAR